MQVDLCNGHKMVVVALLNVIVDMVFLLLIGLVSCHCR